jgi:light-regulated signal transduction histidine kinase (bacteriophytochrome)
MRRTTVDLSALAHAIAAELQKTDPGRQAEFLITPGMIVNGDASLMRVVLQNLLGNAWKFTSRHQHARIEVGCTVQNRETVYFVRDDGAGFDMRYADKLFGTFQRLHTPAEFEGTGIGLATVQRVIRRHGGRIWAIAEPENGATFFFTLPLTPR